MKQKFFYSILIYLFSLSVLCAGDVNLSIFKTLIYNGNGFYVGDVDNDNENELLMKTDSKLIIFKSSSNNQSQEINNILNSKLVGYVKLMDEGNIDLNVFSQTEYIKNNNGKIEGDWLIWEESLKDIIEKEFKWTWDCDSDDAPDDEVPSNITIKFAINKNGDYLVGINGDDSEILFPIAYRGGYAYTDSNDPDKIWDGWRDKTIKSFLLYQIMAQIYYEFLNGVQPKNLHNYFDKFYTENKFGFKNNLKEKIIRVFSAIFHQQADYGWYNHNYDKRDELIRKAWSPATTRDANMTLGRSFTLNYTNIANGIIIAKGGNDNGNWSKFWIDGEKILEQHDCGGILKIFKNKYPKNIKMENYTIWSSVDSQFMGAFLGDKITASNIKEWCNSEINPSNSFDKNPAPFIEVYDEGWKGETYISISEYVSSDNNSTLIFKEDFSDSELNNDLFEKWTSNNTCEIEQKNKWEETTINGENCLEYFATAHWQCSSRAIEGYLITKGDYGNFYEKDATLIMDLYGFVRDGCYGCDNINDSDISLSISDGVNDIIFYKPEFNSEGVEEGCICATDFHVLNKDTRHLWKFIFNKDKKEVRIFKDNEELADSPFDLSTLNNRWSIKIWGKSHSFKTAYSANISFRVYKYEVYSANEVIGESKDIIIQEDFSSLDNWQLFGSPSSQIVNVHDKTNVFDNNGDSWCDSGAISKNSYNFKSKKVTIEADVYLQVDDLAGCWVGPSIGISNGIENTSGSCANDGFSWRGLSMFMAGDACWGTPSQYRRHSYLTGAWGIGKNYSINIDSYINKWVQLKMEIDEKGYLYAYLDGKFLGKSEEKIEDEYLNKSFIYIGGRSSNYGGKAYIDNLKVYVTNESLTPICSEDNISACKTQKECEDIGKYWYNDKCNKTPKEVINLIIKKGWALKALPVKIDNGVNVVEIFNKAGIKTIWKWNGSKWQIWSPSDIVMNVMSNFGLTPMEELFAGEGFWVNASDNVSVSINGGDEYGFEELEINSKWNLVGVGKEILPSSFNELGSIKTIWKWNGSKWQIWSLSNNIMEVMSDFGLSPIERIEKGEGFWVNK